MAIHSLMHAGEKYLGKKLKKQNLQSSFLSEQHRAPRKQLTVYLCAVVSLARGTAALWQGTGTAVMLLWRGNRGENV